MPTEITPDAVPARENRGVGQAYVLLAVCVVLTWVGGGLVQLWSPYPGLAITEIVFILAPAVVYVRLKGLPLAESLGWRKVSIGTGLASAVLGATAMGPALGILLLQEPILGPPPQISFFQLGTFPELVLTWLVAAVLPGICEETLFRGAIQGTLRRRGLPKALVYTSLLFAAFHGNPWNFVPPLFLGLVIGTLAERSGSIVPCMIAHACVNATAFTIGYFSSDEPTPALIAVILALSAGFVAAFGMYLARTRGGQAELPLLSRVPAGLPRWARWLAWGSITSSAALLVAVVLLARSLVGVYAVANDVPGAELYAGDSVIVLKSGTPDFQVSPGDLVAFQRDNKKARVGRVTRRDDKHVWIAEPSGEVEVASQDVVGKVIRTLAGARGAKSKDKEQ